MRKAKSARFAPARPISSSNRSIKSRSCSASRICSRPVVSTCCSTTNAPHSKPPFAPAPPNCARPLPIWKKPRTVWRQRKQICFHPPFDQMEVLLRIKNLLETRRVQMLLDNQRAAFEDRARATELRQALADLEKARDGLAAAQTDLFSPVISSIP